MVTTAERTRLMSAEEFAELLEVPGKRFELVQGEVVEVSGPNPIHGWVVGVMLSFLNGIPGIRTRAFVFAEVAYILSRRPDVVRVPDASIVLRERLEGAALPSEQWEMAPDLAVEVVSPNDSAASVEAKVQEYLAAGTREVWVCWPSTRGVTVFHADGTARRIGPDDELTTPDFLPAASIRAGDLFPELPAQATEESTQP